MGEGSLVRMKMLLVSILAVVSCVLLLVSVVWCLLPVLNPNILKDSIYPFDVAYRNWLGDVCVLAAPGAICGLIGSVVSKLHAMSTIGAAGNLIVLLTIIIR